MVSVCWCIMWCEMVQSVVRVRREGLCENCAICGDSVMCVDCQMTNKTCYIKLSPKFNHDVYCYAPGAHCTCITGTACPQDTERGVRVSIQLCI
jgi:hypothetical protein